MFAATPAELQGWCRDGRVIDSKTLVTCCGCKRSGQWVLDWQDNCAHEGVDLQCAHQHVFEGWFGSKDDFHQQLERGLVSCPLCEPARGEKLSAPR